MVKAVETFVEVDDQTHQIASVGTHGIRLWGDVLWGDVGAGAFGFFRCWSRVPLPPEQMEGVCTP
jgi:hypothetical protein